MPNLDGTQIRVAGTGALWKSPLGTAAPTDSTTAWGTGWLNLGYATEGFTITPDYKTQEITAWQTLDVVRLITTKNTRKVSFEVIQSNTATVSLAFGGATVTPTTGGAYSLDIPDGQLAEFQLGIDWSDGTTTQRLLLKRAAIISLPVIKYMRTDAIRYPLELQALKPADGTNAIKIFGVDAAVAGP